MKTEFEFVFDVGRVSYISFPFALLQNLKLLPLFSTFLFYWIRILCDLLFRRRYFADACYWFEKYFDYLWISGFDKFLLSFVMALCDLCCCDDFQAIPQNLVFGNSLKIFFFGKIVTL